MESGSSKITTLFLFFLMQTVSIFIVVHRAEDLGQSQRFHSHKCELVTIMHISRKYMKNVQSSVNLVSCIDQAYF